MNIENYQMDWYERRDYVRDRALEILEDDDDAFIDAVQELISWNGFIDTECYPMSEIDEICYGMKPSKLIEKMTSDFNSNDDYFYFSIYGLESTNNIADIYRSNITIDEVLNALEENYNHLYLKGELDDIMSILYNDDYGIEEDFVADEDMDEDDEPEETDEEFKDRIDSIY